MIFTYSQFIFQEFIFLVLFLRVIFSHAFLSFISKPDLRRRARGCFPLYFCVSLSLSPLSPSCLFVSVSMSLSEGVASSLPVGQPSPGLVTGFMGHPGRDTGDIAGPPMMPAGTQLRSWSRGSVCLL